MEFGRRSSRLHFLNLSWQTIDGFTKEGDKQRRVYDKIVIVLCCNLICMDATPFRDFLVWAFSADAEVPKVLPLAFFPEPCPYREAALRELARTSRRWHIACTSLSLAGVRAASMAGLAVTPLPKHAIRPGLRVLAKKDNLPILPEVEYVSQTNETETRQIIATFDTLMQEKALR